MAMFRMIMSSARVSDRAHGLNVSGNPIFCAWQRQVLVLAMELRSF